MKTTAEYINILRVYKENHAQQYGITRIGIFGSVARGEHKDDSDVDVYVDLEKPSLFYMVHIKEDLQVLFGTSVDIVRIRKDMDSLLLKDITRDGIYV